MPLGVLCFFVAGAFLLATMISLYSTNMTVRQNRISPWAIVLGFGFVLMLGIGLAISL